MGFRTPLSEQEVETAALLQVLRQHQLRGGVLAARLGAHVQRRRRPVGGDPVGRDGGRLTWGGGRGAVGRRVRRRPADGQRASVPLLRRLLLERHLVGHLEGLPQRHDDLGGLVLHDGKKGTA